MLPLKWLSGVAFALGLATVVARAGGDNDFKKGLNALNAKDWELAIRRFSEVIRQNPKDDHAYINRGIAFEEQGKYSQAINDYQQAVNLRPKNPWGYNDLAWLLATCPKARFRDGDRALLNAVKASELSRHPN